MDWKARDSVSPHLNEKGKTDGQLDCTCYFLGDTKYRAVSHVRGSLVSLSDIRDAILADS